MKVLVAEDVRITRNVLCATIMKWGHEVVPCETGIEAWAALQADDPPKIAILDWMMPGLEGPEICRRVRKTPAIQDTYIILLTGRDSKEDIVAGIEAGADDYVIKPFDRDELRVRLNAGERIVVLQAQALRAEQARVMVQTAGGAAHEINQPLTVILGLVEMWEQMLEKENPMHQDAVMVKESAQRIQNIVQRMQDVKDYVTTDYVAGAKIVDFGERPG